MITIRIHESRARVAFAVACGLAVLLGCFDRPIPTSPSGRLGLASIGVRFNIAAQLAPAARSLQVIVRYARTASPTVLLALDSVVVPLVAGDSSVSVPFDVAACLHDPDHEVPAKTSAGAASLVCVLHVDLLLLDSSNQMVDATTLAPIAATIGVPTVTPPIVMGPRPKPTDALALQQTISCMLNDVGAAYCWGANTAGVFGTGDTVSSAVPRPAAGGMRFVKIGVGNNFACGLALTAAVYCWGAAGSGQLGTGSTATTMTPTPVIGGHQFQSLTVGYAFACGIEVGTSVGYCWGNNGNGALGVGDTVSRSSPVPVSGGFKFTDIQAGAFHACGIVSGVVNAVYCWGWNPAGEVAAGAGTNVLVARAVPLPPSVNAAAPVPGTLASCVLGTDGAGYCWGGNEYGELGLGSTANGVTNSPTKMAGSITFTGLAKARANNTFSGSCGWSVSGAVYCWGINSAGQLGASALSTQCTSGSSTIGCSGTPVLVDGTTGFVAVAAGGEHVCGISKAHTLLCWGLNRNGQLGNGTLVNASVPTPVAGNIRTP